MKIDDDFKALCPALTPEEYAGLEKSLLEEGCRDALVTWNNVLIDGHNRLAICNKHGLTYETIAREFDSREEVKAWIITNQFARRNLTPYQRAELALLLKPTFEAKAKEKEHERKTGTSQIFEKSFDTNQELAKVAGISHATIGKAAKIAEKAPEAIKAKLRTGETSINQAYQQVRQQEKQEKAKAKLEAEGKTVIKSSEMKVYHCSVAELAQFVERGSIDAIITDPPYPAEFLPVYDDLAAFADYALDAGGSLLVMVGQSYLPEIIEKLGRRLTYHWTACYLTPGGQAAQLWNRKVNTFWKPLLWFVKGEYAGNWIGDVCKSEANDKDHHHWGQSETGMADIIRRWTTPGQLVCDPFLGGGTTAVVAARLKRRFVGCDIDVNCVNESEERLGKEFRT